jgi:hypothetical protein
VLVVFVLCAGVDRTPHTCMVQAAGGAFRIRGPRAAGGDLENVRIRTKRTLPDPFSFLGWRDASRYQGKGICQAIGGWLAPRAIGTKPPFRAQL